jgi:hypothetical protein
VLGTHSPRELLAIEKQLKVTYTNVGINGEYSITVPGASRASEVRYCRSQNNFKIIGGRWLFIPASGWMEFLSRFQRRHPIYFNIMMSSSIFLLCRQIAPSPLDADFRLRGSLQGTSHVDDCCSKKNSTRGKAGASYFLNGQCCQKVKN